MQCVRANLTVRMIPTGLKEGDAYQNFWN